MQKLIAVLLFVLAVSVANAESQVKIENGELLASPSQWSATGVKVTPEAQKYPAEVRKTFNNPGELVVTQNKIVGAVVDLFHVRIDAINKSSVRYDAQRAVIDVVAGNEVERTEVFFSPFPFFWLVSVVAFLIFTSKGKNVVVAVFAGAIAFVAPICITALAAALSFVGVAITALAAILAILVATAPCNFKENTRKRASTAFYLFMVLLAGAMYYPLF